MYRQYCVGGIDKILSNKDKYLPKLVQSNTDEKKSDSSKTQKKNFEKLGGDAFTAGDFPQATFWFFQQRKYVKGGQMYRKVEISNRSCEDKWKDFIPFLDKKHKEGMIKQSTSWYEVQTMWQRNQKEFEKLAVASFDSKDFPQATFWFFQHRMYNLDGKPYDKVKFANSRCKEGWKDFSSFLNQKPEKGILNKNTSWFEIQSLWLQKQKHFEELGGICFDAGDYPQATFWFLQHQLNNLDGQPYANVDIAHGKCGEDWQGFPIFIINQAHIDGSIDLSTTWSEVQGLWDPKLV